MLNYKSLFLIARVIGWPTLAMHHRKRLKKRAHLSQFHRRLVKHHYKIGQPASCVSWIHTYREESVFGYRGSEDVFFHSRIYCSPLCSNNATFPVAYTCHGSRCAAPIRWLWLKARETRSLFHPALPLSPVSFDKFSHRERFCWHSDTSLARSVTTPKSNRESAAFHVVSATNLLVIRVIASDK